MKPSATFFAGKTISIGGKFTYGKSKSEFAQMMREAGATVANKLGATVAYHVVGREDEKAEASETAAAAKLGVAVIGERFARECWSLADDAKTAAPAKRTAANATKPGAGAKHLARIEKHLGRALPERLQAFLTNPPTGQLCLEDGFMRGTFTIDYHDDALVDRSGLGEASDIDDLDDVDWDDALVPVALLLDDDGTPVKAFLVADTADPQCPILLFHHDGWTLYPVAPSIDAFTAGTAGKSKSKKSNRNLGEAYKRFRWK